MQVPKQYLGYLIVARYEGVNRLFVWSIENTANRTVHTKYYPPFIERNYYNVMIDGQKLCWSTSKKLFKNIW